MDELTRVLLAHGPVKVVAADLAAEPCVLLDFSAANPAMASLDTADIDQFCAYIDTTLAAAGSRFGLGGYNENRVVYRHSRLFEGGAVRSLHLGLDIWTAADMPVLAAYDGRVHSFARNDGVGNYGATIILEHELDGQKFFSLYGHLAYRSLEGKEAGQPVRGGSCIGWLGEPAENGAWPPHLHFQLIRDMAGRQGDFPGVCAPSEAEHYLSLCPNPNSALQLAILDQ